MNLAGRAWSAYNQAPDWQRDLIETLVMSMGVTGASAVLSDMSPEELAVSAGLSMGAGMAGRPVGRAAGGALGRQVDKVVPEFTERVPALMHAHVDAHPSGRAGVDEGMHHLVNRVVGTGEPGSRGAIESMGRFGGQLIGDNLLQLGVAAAVPGMLNNGERPASSQHVEALNAMLDAGEITQRQYDAML